MGLIGFCSKNTDLDKHEFRLSGKAFGTSYHITIRDKLKHEHRKKNLTKKLSYLMENLIEKLDASMSNWRPDSTINKINKSKAYQKIPIDQDFQKVFLKSKLIYKKTNKAFDPGSASLFELWDFRTDKDHQHIHTIPKTLIPPQKEIQRQIQSGGLKSFILNRGEIYKTNSQAKLNLSALAKGYLVDQMFGILKKYGYRKTLVEVGGELRVGVPIGTPREKQNWKIGIEKPRYDQKRSLLFVARLKNQAMATSGDYRNYFRIENDPSKTIYSHIINPLTGRPKDTRIVSATVIGPECMTADALATTLLVLSPKQGLKMLHRFSGYEALLLEKADFPGKPPLNQPAKPRPSTYQNKQKTRNKTEKIKIHAKKHGLKAYLSPSMSFYLDPF